MTIKIRDKHYPNFVGFPGANIGTKFEQMYREARYVHVFLMRCDGETYRQIADRIGVTTASAAHLVHRKACIRLALAWRKVL